MTLSLQEKNITLMSMLTLSQSLTNNNNNNNNNIIPLCKHVVAKVILVPCSVNFTGKRDKVGHGEATINNA